MTPRKRVLKLLNRQEIDRVPCFSGMGNVLMDAMNHLGLKFEEAQKEPQQMATLAASTYKLTNFECAVVPFDVTFEAEALGCEINFHEMSSEEILYPTVKQPILEIGQPIEPPEDLLERGRIPLILEAIQLIQKDVGKEIAIGSYVLGPYTLAGVLTDLDQLLKLSYKNPTKVKIVLESLVDVIAIIAQAFKKAGVDYITVREMGATTDLISPRLFKTVVLPYLQALLNQITTPKVLHICGKTTPILELMEETGVEAISIGQKNDITQSREKLKRNTLLFGNIDGFGVLTKGSPGEIKKIVREVIKSGVDAIWPACDIWPTAPLENIKALVEATKLYGIRDIASSKEFKEK
ncbi:MAG: MtaA/CmuA family methyltransferase [Candidatus Heimdallarchaeota archaeon]